MSRIKSKFPLLHKQTFGTNQIIGKKLILLKVLLIILILSASYMSPGQVKIEYFTLKEALETAKDNNPVLKTGYYNIDIARTDVISAKLRPNFTFGSEIVNIGRYSGLEPGTRWLNPHNREALFQLGKSFNVAGQRHNKIELADINVSLTEKEYAETERNLFLEVADKWLEVWNAHKNLEIIETAYNNIDSLVKLNEIRFKNEVVTQTDLLRTIHLEKMYSIQLSEARQDLKILQKEMQYLLGIQDSADIDSSDDFHLKIPVLPDTLMKISLQHRSDIKSAQTAVDASESNIKLQKSLAYPQPELGFVYNPQYSVPYFGIYAAVDLPFFDRNQGEREKSFIIKKQAEQNLSTVKTLLEIEISTAYANYELHKKNIEEFSEIAQQSELILENVKYAYLKGGTTIIDFLEAQRSWLETQQHYYDISYRYRKSYIKLLHVTGLINQLAL